VAISRTPPIVHPSASPSPSITASQKDPILKIANPTLFHFSEIQVNFSASVISATLIRHLWMEDSKRMCIIILFAELSAKIKMKNITFFEADAPYTVHSMVLVAIESSVLDTRYTVYFSLQHQCHLSTFPFVPQDDIQLSRTLQSNS
jgi:hypothetical protein